MNFSTLSELKEIAVAISSTIKVKHLGKIESFDPAPYIGLTKRYSVENNTIAFFTDTALYVLPYFRNAARILNANFYQNIAVDVPFANGEIPMLYEKKWNNLLNEAKKQSIIDFRNDCIKYCKELGIKEIEDYLLENFCMELPEEGILVSKPYPYPELPHKDTEKVFPFIMKHEITPSVIRKLAKYSIKNGICTFIYLNGKTYVTKNEVIICILQNSGFLKHDFKTILTGNETILDPEYAKKWESLR